MASTQTSAPTREDFTALLNETYGEDEAFEGTVVKGRVVAIGPGGRDENGKLIPIDVKVGDLVLFGKWSGTEVKMDGVEYLIMKESDIMGVLAEAEAKKKAA